MNVGKRNESFSYDAANTIKVNLGSRLVVYVQMRKLIRCIKGADKFTRYSKSFVKR